MPRIPLLEELTNEPVPAGSPILVEFDPASQWPNVYHTIAAGWLKTGGRVDMAASDRPPEKTRSYLNRLGLEAEELEKEDRLMIYDCYTPSLGRKSQERLSIPLKVADASIWWSKQYETASALATGLFWLRTWDNISILDRFNDEKTWVEFVLARVIPNAYLRKETAIRGVMRGVHSEWVYKRLEMANDGIVDIRLDESSDPPRNLIRIRTMRDVAFDARWRHLRVGENFEVTLEK